MIVEASQTAEAETQHMPASERDHSDSPPTTKSLRVVEAIVLSQRHQRHVQATEMGCATCMGEV